MEKLSEIEEKWVDFTKKRGFDKDTIFAAVLYFNSDEKLQEAFNYLKTNSMITEDDFVKKYFK